MSKALVQAIREAALSATASTGFKLAREKAVTVESASDVEVVARVRAPGFAVPPTAILYPQELEWTCDCGAPVDPCPHVVAAAVALSQPELLQKTAPEERGHFRYRLTRPQPAQLALGRELVVGGKAQPFTSSLAGLLGQPHVQVEQHDIRLDTILRALRASRLVLTRAGETFKELAQAKDVWFETTPIRIDAEPLPPVATVTRDKTGEVVLRIERPEGIDEIIAPCVARLGNVLRPLKAVTLTGMRLERLPIERRFGPHNLADLVTVALPELEAHLDVDIQTELPGRTRTASKPRLTFQVESQTTGIEVLPLLVYGNPPEARVDKDSLVLLSGSVPKRDLQAEQELVVRLRNELNLVPGRKVHYARAEAARFTEKLMTFQAAFEPGGARGIKVLDLAYDLKLAGDKLELEFHLEGRPNSEVPTQSVLDAWESGAKLVALPEGGFGALPKDWLDRFGPWLVELWSLRDQKGQLPLMAAPLVVELCENLELTVPPSFSRLTELAKTFDKLPEVDPPRDLAAALRPYQRQGVNWLCFLRAAGLGGLLADDMGLGKTLQTLCAVSGRTLIVCPKSLLFNWASEAQRFRPGLRVSVYTGPERKLEAGADITLTTHGILRLDAATLEKVHWDTVVIDEAQAIKNPESQLAQAAYRLKADFRVALSGTPVENRLEDLFSQMHFVNPGLLGGRQQFQARYAKPIEQGNLEAQTRLQARIRPFVLRRLKRDVAKELPPRTDVVLPVELEQNERVIYDAILESTKQRVLQELKEGKNLFFVFEALLRLRQAACHLALLPGKEGEATSSKVECLMERLEEASSEGHKSIVFSQWTSLLDLVEPHLEARGLPFVRLDGSTRDRGAVVTAFQAEGGPPVLLASLKAGGTGLNLTAADHIFLLDPWWNPAAEDQAADRAHRIGQTRPVFVHRLVAKGTIDERILLLQESKRALLDAALTPGAVSMELTREDLANLLGLD